MFDYISEIQRQTVKMNTLHQLDINNENDLISICLKALPLKEYLYLQYWEWKITNIC